MTDRAEMLQLARRNAAANDALVRSAGGSLDVQELDWDDAGSEIMSRPWDVVIGECWCGCSKSDGLPLICR